jgi:AcrR family transcriptional regulator
VSRSRAAVLRSATDLFVEGGPSAVTIDAIVARSGVAKSTIYRHWSSRDDVLVEVIESSAPEIPQPDPDLDVATALRQTAHAIAGFINDPDWARMLPALLLMKHHAEDIAAIEERLEREQDQVMSGLIRRAMDEGLLRSGIDVEEAITSLLGPLLYAHLTERVELDEGFVDRTVDRFFAAFCAQS